MTANNPAPQYTPDVGLTPLQGLINDNDVEIVPEPGSIPSRRKAIRHWQRKQGRKGFLAAGGNARCR